MGVKIMKKCIVILLATIVVFSLTGCMQQSTLDTLYSETQVLENEIAELKENNKKLENDNELLEEELQDLKDENQSKEKVKVNKEQIILEEKLEKSKETGMGITPTEFIYYLFNLTVIEKEFDDLYINSTPYTYTWDDGDIVYVYNFVYNKKDDRVIFLELEMAGDEKHIAKINLFYEKENGDIKQYKMYKQYIKLVSYAFVMVKEQSKVLDEKVLEKAESFCKNNRFGQYNRCTLERQNYDTFYISGY